ncbi:MAG: hypothetical protein ACI87E_000090 [Mariniblastus sp.]|jgi:hypothetical protein
MKDQTVLLTGDFWHQDFKEIISSFGGPVTMVPIDKVSAVEAGKFDLIVVAQSRRDQFEKGDVELIQATFANTPVVGLLGSWCEGEVRSGQPFPGVIRVYWHQWQGRYDEFVRQLDASGVSHWHEPRTATVGDRIGGRPRSPKFLEKQKAKIQFVGVSARASSQFEMLADAIQSFGWQVRWIERGTWDADSANALGAICVEADSWNEDVENRVRWLSGGVATAPLVLLLNYPRAHELETIRLAGVAEVVSKPFELVDLKAAIERAVQSSATSKSVDGLSI